MAAADLNLEVGDTVDPETIMEAGMYLTSEMQCNLEVLHTL